MIVLKWTVPADGASYPIGSGKILHVASQYGQDDEVQIWTEEPYLGAPMTRAVSVVGTGQAYTDNWTGIGSLVTASGQYVWHLLELKS